ncbi:hypothetical protein [Solilutibacter silvestris]|uniref:hypothetical protein n=1 Tax=Solilutibacter silvestris TaxID=1645665 RepID=UPI003D32B5AB
MRYRRLDASGDYSFGRQNANFYQNQPEAVAQAIQTRLQLFTGEWFLDLTEGTPWQTDVLGKYTQDVYDSAIKDRVLGTTGVSEIVAYTSTFNGQTRSLSVSMTVSTLYGSTQLDLTL